MPGVAVEQAVIGFVADGEQIVLLHEVGGVAHFFCGEDLAVGLLGLLKIMSLVRSLTGAPSSRSRVP